MPLPKGLVSICGKLEQAGEAVKKIGDFAERWHELHLDAFVFP